MGAGKTKVISVRLEEELYKEIETQAKKRNEPISQYVREVPDLVELIPQGEKTISQYVREVLYSFHYPTDEILKKLEENKSRLDYSIQNAEEYIERLMGFSKDLQEALKDFGRKVGGGAIQFPLMVSEKTKQEAKKAGKKVKNGNK